MSRIRPELTDERSHTIAGYLFSRLVEAGVRHIFGVPGDFNLTLLDRLDDFPELTWIGNANELNAAYAADGYARLSGLGVVITTYGVGELSAINGIAGSYAESVPVLHIVGAPSTLVQRNRLPVHHSLLDGDPRHFVRAYQEVTCASAELTEHNAAAEIDRVLRACLTEKRPAYLSLPADLIGVPLAAPSAPIDDLDTAPTADLTEFTQGARELLDHATTVSVLADHLADRHHARRALTELIQAGGLPTAVLSPAKGLVEENLPEFLGLYAGALSAPRVRSAIEEAEVLIGVGLRLADLSTGGFTHHFRAESMIDVGPDIATIGTTSYKVRMPEALAALTTIVAERGHRPRIEAEITATTAPPDAALTLDAPLTQDVLWQQLGAFLRPGDLIAGDQGTSVYGLLPMRLPAGVDVINQPLWASIGYSLPALLGAQLASRPGRRSVLVIGDGAYQLTAQELGTFLRHGLDPIILLINNDGYTVERAINGPNAAYNDIARWNWTAVPAAFGADRSTFTARVTSGRELDAALATSAENRGRLSFIEVVTDRHDLPELLSRLSRVVAMQNKK